MRRGGDRFPGALQNFLGATVVVPVALHKVNQTVAVDRKLSLRFLVVGFGQGHNSLLDFRYLDVGHFAFLLLLEQLAAAIVVAIRIVLLGVQCLLSFPPGIAFLEQFEDFSAFRRRREPKRIRNERKSVEMSGKMSGKM